MGEVGEAGATEGVAAEAGAEAGNERDETREALSDAGKERATGARLP